MTRSIQRILIIAAVAAALAVALPQLIAPAAASNEIARDTGLVCTACHDKPGSKLLTDRGKYWELMGSLEGFDEIEGAFGKCTHCHARKPGSARLTAEGRKLADVVESMEGLRQWVMQAHPQPPAEDGETPPDDASEASDETTPEPAPDSAG